jgi:hypothetical protein
MQRLAGVCPTCLPLMLPMLSAGAGAALRASLPAPWDLASPATSHTLEPEYTGQRW